MPPGKTGEHASKDDEDRSSHAGIIRAVSGRASQILRTSTQPRATTPSTYVERINLAIDYVVSHLDEPLRLSKVARTAMFSPFHFHRVFQAMVGETLADFVKRLRLEKALSLMTYSRRRSLTEIALACGFSSSSDFSRSFKQRFGAAPSAFDVDEWRRAHRIRIELQSHRQRSNSTCNAFAPATIPTGSR